MLSASCYQEMSDSPRYDPLEASSYFEDGTSARQPPESTIARGDLELDGHLYRGMRGGDYARGYPFPLDQADLERGRERFGIYCVPCHGAVGTGDGIIARRGFEEVKSLHRAPVRRAPEGYLFEVVTRGRGPMPAYGKRIDARDRWRIVAYVRALQLSQHARLSDVPATERDLLLREGGR